jgi:hypothetical protein
MAVELSGLFARCGPELIAFLDYCVFSGWMEPVFAFLVGEYGSNPTASRALALYDTFCAAGAPGRLKAYAVLTPRDLRLDEPMRDVRRRWLASRQPRVSEDDPVAPVPLPPRFLFQFILDHLNDDPESILHVAARSFDPLLSPFANLPGGRMSPGHQAFVDGVWRPRIRPTLVGAGFWRIANIGG